jgi:hypothetical protein
MKVAPIVTRIFEVARRLWSRCAPLPTCVEPLQVAADLCCRSRRDLVVGNASLGVVASTGGPPQVIDKLCARLSDLLAAAHDDFRPGNRCGEWFDDRRNLVQTGLGPVPG